MTGSHPPEDASGHAVSNINLHITYCFKCYLNTFSLERKLKRMSPSFSTLIY